MKTEVGILRQPVYRVRPTKGSCSHGEVFKDLSGDVAFQASHDLETVEPFGSTTRHIGPGFWVLIRVSTMRCSAELA